MYSKQKNIILDIRKAGNSTCLFCFYMLYRSVKALGSLTCYRLAGERGYL